MKKIIFLLLIFVFIVGGAQGSIGIVDNSTTRDSVSIPCNPIDTLGQPVNLVSGDSLWLTVFYPGGAAAYRDSSDWNDTQILRLGTPNGPCSTYVWADQIADIDGSGVNGVYTYQLVISDASLSLNTERTGWFQVIDEPLDATLAALTDSVNALLDTLQLWDTRIDSLEAALADANIGDKVWTDGSFTPRGYLDASIAAVLADVTGINGWTPILDNDSLVVDQSSLEDMSIDSVRQVANVENLDQSTIYTQVARHAADTFLTRITGDTAIAGYLDSIANRVLEDSSSYQGSASGLTAAQIADAVWDEDSTGHYTSPNMAFVASQTSASSLDSATISRIVGRKVWGIASGSGSDSTALTDRKANVSSMDADVITSASIAADAIGASEIAASAIGTSEFAAEEDNIGIDWSDIDNKTSIVNLSNTSVDATVAAFNLGAITSSAFASGAITNSVFATGAIDSTTIAADAIGESEINTGAITADEIATNAITHLEIASGAIGADEIETNAIGANEIALSAAQEIADTVWGWATKDVNVASVDVGAVEAGDIGVAAITASSIASGAIGQDEIAANAISSSELAEAAIDELWEYATANITSTSGIGKYILDSISGGSGSTDTTAILALGANHPDIFYGPSGSGSDPNSVMIFAIDTSAATDDTLSGILVTADNAVGSMVYYATTDDSGKVDFNMAAGTFTFKGWLPRYIFGDTSIAISSNDTIAVLGYALDPASAPASPDLCAVSGTIEDGAGNGIPFAKVTFTLPEVIVDTCRGVMVLATVRDTITDASGNFTIDLIKSKCLKGQKYTISVDHLEYGRKSHEFSVPDAATYVITWEE